MVRNQKGKGWRFDNSLGAMRLQGSLNQAVIGAGLWATEIGFSVIRISAPISGVGQITTVDAVLPSPVGAKDSVGEETGEGVRGMVDDGDSEAGTIARRKT